MTAHIPKPGDWKILGIINNNLTWLAIKPQARVLVFGGHHHLETYHFEKGARISFRSGEHGQELPVVKAFFLYLKSDSKTQFTTNDIAKFLEYSTNLSPTTARRRASTISSWLKQQKIIKNRNESFYIDDDSNQTRLNEFINGSS